MAECRHPGSKTLHSWVMIEPNDVHEIEGVDENLVSIYDDLSLESNRAKLKKINANLASRDIPALGKACALDMSSYEGWERLPAYIGKVLEVLLHADPMQEATKSKITVQIYGVEEKCPSKLSPQELVSKKFAPSYVLKKQHKSSSRLPEEIVGKCEDGRYLVKLQAIQQAKTGSF
eukprot:g69101.t1